MKLAEVISGLFHKSKSNHNLCAPLERSSLDMTRTRLQTRRNSLENSHVPEAGEDYVHEELHTVVPREDSIKLAKQRISLSHDHEQIGSFKRPLDWEASDDQSHHVHWASNATFVCSS